jgi:integrase
MRGYLYQRGRIWWMKYYVSGRAIQESTGLSKKSAAARVLAQKVGRAAAGEPIPPRVDRITYDEAVADLRRDYKITGERDARDVEKRLAHLDPFFRGRRLVAIGPVLVTEYIERRQAPRPAANGADPKPGASNGTINRELAMLGKMFRLAVDNGKALRKPKIPKLEEAAPRKGFVDRDRFEAIVRRLPEPHDLAVRICYALAWRRGEVFGLKWRHVDLDRGALRLFAGETKNDEGRNAFLPPDLAEQLRAHRARVEELQRKLSRVIPEVFVRLKGKLAGRPIGSFRKTWARACRAAGAPGLLVHDLRRSGIRNMIRAGVSEHTAMKVSGHLTRAVFDRYDIVDERDLQEAARRIAAVAAVSAAVGTIAGTIGRAGVKSVR